MVISLVVIVLCRPILTCTCISLRCELDQSFTLRCTSRRVVSGSTVLGTFGLDQNACRCLNQAALFHVEPIPSLKQLGLAWNLINAEAGSLLPMQLILRYSLPDISIPAISMISSHANFLMTRCNQPSNCPDAAFLSRTLRQ